MSEVNEQPSCEQRQEVWGKTGGHCAFCGVGLPTNKFAVTLLVSHTHGGKNEPENLLPCCRSCQGAKRNRTLEEFRRWRQWEDVCRDQRFSLAQMDWLLANTNIAETHPREPYVFFFEGDLS